jgi:hypothetical protein
MNEPVHSRVFRVWVEDWEKELLKNNDCVAEARLLEKYKGLVFFDPDNNCTYTVWNKNLEYQKGGNGGWCVIGVPADDSLDNESFLIGDMIIQLIGDNDQAEHVHVIRASVEK